MFQTLYQCLYVVVHETNLLQVKLFKSIIHLEKNQAKIHLKLFSTVIAVIIFALISCLEYSLNKLTSEMYLNQAQFELTKSFVSFVTYKFYLVPFCLQFCFLFLTKVMRHNQRQKN